MVGSYADGDDLNSATYWLQRYLTEGVEIFFYKKNMIKVAISKNNRKFAFYKISLK